jgi:hypothetical protein
MNDLIIINILYSLKQKQINVKIWIFKKYIFIRKGNRADIRF